MTQDTGKKRNSIDKFYTNEDVARECISTLVEVVPDVVDYLWIEPSAGSGSFLHNIPVGVEAVGVDISPASDDIQEADYLTWEPPTTGRDIVVFGNPPFGRQSSTAKAFIARSCRFATVIAFILPRSFTKPSMFNAFDSKFHLIKTIELRQDSFTVNGNAYDVPCVFQVWLKKKHDRKEIVEVKPCGYTYAKAGDEHDIVVRRVGVFAGRCYSGDDGVERSPQSHHFIKLSDDIVDRVDDIIDRMNEHVFPSNTVGPRSLSKTEINEVLNDILNEDGERTATDIISRAQKDVARVMEKALKDILELEVDS